MKVTTCPICDTVFEAVRSGSGRLPSICSDACRKESSLRSRKRCAENRPRLRCSLEGCSRYTRSINTDVCDVHYCRKRRTGNYGTKPTTGRYVTGAGYVKLLKPGHPLAEKCRLVFEHRFVAHEKHEGKCPPCFWCGKKLTWGDAVIDHFNEDKADNAPGNLAVACTPCNRARGAILPFIKRMTPQAFEVFVFYADLWNKTP